MGKAEAMRHLCRDRRMARVVRAVGEYDIPVRRNRFESLVAAITAQQISGHAAAAISRRFRAMYRPARFPSPAAVAATPEARLRAAGLSRTKAAYIRGLAAAVESGGLRLDRLPRMGDEEVVRELSAVPGIGRWTAEVFMIFTLGREDVMPVSDLGVRKGVGMMYSTGGLPSEGEVRRIAERWRPYRSAATWYVWRALHEWEKAGMVGPAGFEPATSSTPG